ncbi:MAG: MFS transporter [Desulfobaccales bacterium]
MANHDSKGPAGPGAAPSRLISTSTLTTILFCSLYFLMYLDRVNISMGAKSIIKDFNLSHVELGLAFSAFSWPYLVGQWVGGWSANKIGAKLTLALCVFVAGVATFFSGIVVGLATLFAARLFVGIGEGPVFSAATQGMKHWYSGKRYGYIQGITHAAARFGGALAPLIVAWCIALSGWRLSFFVCALLTLAWLAFWWLNFSENPREHPHITAAEVAELVPPTKGVRNARTPWWPLIKRIFPVTMVDFAYGWMLWVFLSWIPLYFMTRFHLDLKSSALHSAFALIAGVVGDTLGGLFSDWLLVKTSNKLIARNAFIASGLLLSGGFLTATLFTHDLTLVTLFLFGTFLCSEAVCGPIWAVPMDISHEYAGIGSGIMNSGFAIAGVISPIVFGLVIDHFKTWDAAFYLTIAICVAGAVLCLFMRPDIPFVPPQEVFDSQAD